METNKKIYKIFAAGGLIFILASGATFGFAAAPFRLSQEQLADLVQPSIVRIVNEIKGRYSIPAFDIDLSNLQPVFIPNKESVVTPVDTYITGSGFAVSPNGYIVTNSHVVSSGAVTDDLLGQAWLDELTKKLASLTPAQLSQVKADLQKKFGSLNEGDFEKIGQQILQPLKDKSQFDVKNIVVVLNPSSVDNDLKQLIRLGFPAKVISVNSSFAKDQRDVALIKIDENNLPALPLASKSGLTSGQKIFVFSYPATATFNGKDFLQPSFTPGVINAVKNSDSVDFKIFQTDAKISAGSSGSPLIDDRGRVNAVVTFQTGPSNSGKGDNFAFALPVELAGNVIKDSGIKNDPSVFYEPFFEGLALQDGRHCRSAIDKFKQAERANSNFISFGKINKYISACQESIKAGNSLDSSWDSLKDKLRGIPGWVWYAIAASIAAIGLLIFIIFRQSRWLKKEQREIELLETEVARDHASALKNSGRAADMPSVPLPPER